MYYSNIKYNDVSNGIGIRTTLFVSGCSHKCKGCFNENTWDFKYGKPYDETTEKQILDSLDSNYISGFSLLGGEPFEIENQKVLVTLLKNIKIKYPNKTIWCYTGFLLDDLLPNGRVNTQYTMEMLSYIDILVDGPFILKLLDISLKFKGSSNQRIINIPETLKTSNIVLWNN